MLRQSRRIIGLLRAAAQGEKAKVQLLRARADFCFSRMAARLASIAGVAPAVLATSTSARRSMRLGTEQTGV